MIARKRRKVKRIGKYKHCSACDQWKPQRDYWKDCRAPDGYQYLCKPCQQKANLASRRKHPETAKRWFRNKSVENTIEIRKLLLKRGCKVCGIRDTDVLDFHHVKPKRYQISAMKGLAWKTIQAEIARCEILCANCHRRKTWVQQGWW